MKLFRTLFIAVLAVMLWSCGNKESDDKVEFYQLLHEVFDVHDEMMPQMGKLSELRQELEKRVEEEPMNAITYQEAIADLEAAHKGMMDWMKDFGEVFPYKEDRLEGMSEEEIKESIELMKEQQVSVDAMKQDMVQSMENARAILGN